MRAIQSTSLVGRIHEMLGEMQKQGRMSCAEIATVMALTWHPELPDFFRDDVSGPVQAILPGNRVPLVRTPTPFVRAAAG